MLTQSLIHIAILAYFLVPSAHVGKIDLHAGKKTTTKSTEKVAVFDQTFGEKCVVRSDVPALLPKGSISSRGNLDQLMSDFDAACEVVVKYRSGIWVPYHEALPKRFDALLSKATPTAVTETSGVGEIIAMKLNLYSKPASPQAEFKETEELRSSIRQIGAERGLNKRIARLTRGWLSTFQLPFAWDNGNFEITHRNESTPPLEETISYPDTLAPLLTPAILPLDFAFPIDPQAPVVFCFQIAG